MAVVLRDMLGFNIKLIPGYTEATCCSSPWSAARSRDAPSDCRRSLQQAGRLKPDGMMRVMWCSGRRRGIRTTRRADGARIAKSDKDRRLIELLEVPYRAFASVCGTARGAGGPRQGLQEAFLATHKDPGYLDDAAKLNIDISPIGGAEVLRLIDQIAKTPEDELKGVEKLVTRGRLSRCPQTRACCHPGRQANASRSGSMYPGGDLFAGISITIHAGVHRSRLARRFAALGG